MQDQSHQPQESKSTFVTVLAWIFIVLAGFTTLISILQNIMIFTMFSHEQVHFPPAKQSEQSPAFFGFMSEHFQFIFLAFFVVSATALIAAVGLLRRKNWARITFIAILGLGIVWNVGSLVLQQVMFSSITDFPSNMPADFRAEFDRMASVMRVVSFIFALGFCTLFAWLIKRLLSRAVRVEFAKAP